LREKFARRSGFLEGQLLSEVIGAVMFRCAPKMTRAWHYRRSALGLCPWQAKCCDADPGHRVGGAIGGWVILHGANGAAGHLGHTTIDPWGGLCICGNYGCLERIFRRARSNPIIGRTCTGPRPQKLSVSSTGEVPNPEAIFRAAAGGDECARYVVDRALEYLAAALVSFLHTFDPEIFILGGNIAAAGPQLIAPIQNKIASRTKTLLGREVPIVFQKLVGYGGVAGAAGLVFLKQRLLAI
jgi:glucokinase